MRNLGIVLLIVSVLLGGIVVLGLRHLSSARATPDNHLNRTTVVVATRSISFGEALTPELLRVQAWPAGAQPQGSFQTIAQVTAQKRVALGPIAANEPVLVSRISGPGARASLSGTLRAGMRASTIRVNDVVGVAGFVLPGDFVDVLLTRDEGGRIGSQEHKRTDVLLRSVRVLAVDQSANENKNDPVVAKATTVEVTPEQAEKLALASQVGSLSLALRATADPLASDDEPVPPTVRNDDLRLAAVNTAPPAPRVRRVAPRVHVAPAPVDPGPTVEIYRGVQGSIVHIAREQVG